MAFPYKWIQSTVLLDKHRKDGIQFKPLKYDSLRKDPVAYITEIFKYLELPLDLVGIAHKTMELDSQAGTPSPTIPYLC